MDPSDIPDLPELAVELRADGTGCLTLPDGAHPIEDSDVRWLARPMAPDAEVEVLDRG